MIKLKFDSNLEKDYVGKLSITINGYVDTSMQEIMYLMNAILDSFYKTYNLKEDVDIIEAKRDFLRILNNNIPALSSIKTEMKYEEYEGNE